MLPDVAYKFHNVLIFFWKMNIVRLCNWLVWVLPLQVLCINDSLKARRVQATRLLLGVAAPG
jgi:hypothetical protein